MVRGAAQTEPLPAALRACRGLNLRHSALWAVYGRGILCVPLTWGFACPLRGSGVPGAHLAGAIPRRAGRLLSSGSCRAFGVREAKSALVLGDCGLPHHAIARSGALFAMHCDVMSLVVSGCVEEGGR